MKVERRKRCAEPVWKGTLNEEEGVVGRSQIENVLKKGMH